MIYFDNNATTPVLPEVAEAVRPYFEMEFGNPNTIYQLGGKARNAVEKARNRVARALGVKPTEIIFTGSGSEADNHAVLGALVARGKKNLVVSSIEHDAVGQTAQWAAKLGFEPRVAPFRVRDGQVDPAPFIELFDDETALVSVMHANNETGVIMPLETIFREARSRGILTHTDAVQSFGKIPVKSEAMDCDMLSLSAHKFHGPKGVGALYVRKGVKIEPLIHGGPQENQRRAGTENVANIVGLGVAAEIAAQADMGPVCELRDTFEEKLLQVWGDRIDINHRGLPRTPNTSSVCFKQQDGNLLLIKLDRKGICVSTGSACHSGSLSVSGTLLRMGMSEAHARGTIRFSFSKFNTMNEVEAVLDALITILPIK